MNNILLNVKNFIKKLSESSRLSKKKLLAVSLLMTGAVSLIFSEITKSETVAQDVPSTSLSYSSDEYITDLEKRLESIISSVDGAGETKVMITLESGSEEIYLHDYDYGENIDPSGKNIIERKDEYVIVDGDSGEKGIVVKIAEPKIRGVAVVCKGGNLPSVQARITEIVTALLDISSTGVSVAGMS